MNLTPQRTLLGGPTWENRRPPSAFARIRLRRLQLHLPIDRGSAHPVAWRFGNRTIRAAPTGVLP